MNNRTLLMGLLLSVAVNLGVLGRATYRYCCSRMGTAAGIESNLPCQRPWYAEIQLSATQTDQINQIHSEMQGRIEPLQKEMKRLRREFLDLFRSGTTDRRILELKIEEMSAVQERIEKVVADSLLREREALSPEQQGKLLMLLERRFTQEDHHNPGTITPCNTIPGGLHPGREPR